jgi:AraC family transcriptional regulator
MMTDPANPAEPREIIRMRSRFVTIGACRIPPADPNFEKTAVISASYFSFPRTAFWIQHEGRPAFVADQSVVTYCTRGRRYARKKLSAEGVRCNWFQVDPATLREIFRFHDPHLTEQNEDPFPFTHGPRDLRSHLLHQCVIRYLKETARPDVLFVEETIMGILRRCMGAAFQARGRFPKAATEGSRHRQRETIQDAKALLAQRFREPLTLSDLASALDCSVFHLCRVFQSCVGTTIHKHILGLRLGASVDLLYETKDDLTQLALDLGFSSHSHFTAAFRQAFGIPPSRVRALPPSLVLRLLRKH